MGNPLVCDGLYGKDNPVYISSIKKRYHLSKNEEEEMPILSRIGLHAYQLTFKHPNGKLLSIEAPLPKDMSAMLNQCRKWLK
jgi:23S rRNA pseudouridine955/2504/2580 synthase/23S rRNA pseudouridine1911/1915/1917 synthase